MPVFSSTHPVTRVTGDTGCKSGCYPRNTSPSCYLPEEILRAVACAFSETRTDRRKAVTGYYFQSTYKP